MRGLLNAVPSVNAFDADATRCQVVGTFYGGHIAVSAAYDSVGFTTFPEA